MDLLQGNVWYGSMWDAVEHIECVKRDAAR